MPFIGPWFQLMHVVLSRVPVGGKLIKNVEEEFLIGLHGADGEARPRRGPGCWCRPLIPAHSN